MALTDDQKAMLRLLAQREEGYEDIAALMGLSVDEVRARVKEALAEMGTQDSSASDQGSEFSAAGPVAGDGGALRAGRPRPPHHPRHPRRRRRSLTLKDQPPHHTQPPLPPSNQQTRDRFRVHPAGRDRGSLV